MARVQLPSGFGAGLAWSSEQRAIFDWFATGSGNLVIRARAGTGKTTTLLEGVERAPERRILMTAFNKSIADELQQRISNSYVRARTLHSLGLSFCHRHIDELRIDKRGERAKSLANRAARGLIAGRDDVDVDPHDISTIAGLHTKIREILVDPLFDFPIARRAQPLNETEKAELAKRVDQIETFAVSFGFDGVREDRGFWTRARITEAALNAVEFAKEDTDQIDFADMIFLPLVHGWAFPVCDLLVVDEAQDQSESQLQLALLATSDEGRVCIAGDDRQAIYGFRGAGENNLDRLKETLGAEELGLKTTYRCPQSVVRLAQEFVRDYYAAPTAPAGAVSDRGSVLDAVPGDFVLSRTNAALVEPCLRLIRAGKRAYIKGSEIGKAALALIEKFGRCANLELLQKKLDAWRDKEIRKLEGDTSKAADAKRERILDQYHLVDAFIEGSSSYSEMLDNIRTTFADTPKVDAVMCSTVHKAKGLESTRVFLVVDTFRRDTPEEDNICYVATTRAKSELSLLGTRERLIAGAPAPGDPSRGGR